LEGGCASELDLYLPHSKPQIVRTDEDTIALVRRLATHYPDGMVAGILNRQGRKTAYGHRFQAPCLACAAPARSKLSLPTTTLTPIPFHGWRATGIALAIGWKRLQDRINP
jgi:hypothetical protein